ncbi:MAG TPA: ABC transporter ATP-binding protein, partial [Verrucomicrobiae bacterium]|nr:ABC transporter ATP-binding protein [Verrucomicrobiae bacterium]
DRNLFVRLISYLKPYARTMGFAGIFMLIASLTELSGPLLLRYAIDRHIMAGDILGLWQVVAFYACVLAVNWITTYYNTYLSTLSGQKAIFDLRQELFEHLQTLSFSYFDRRKAGKIMSRFTNDINALNQFLTSGILNTASDLIILTGIVVAMLSMSWRLALATFLTLPLIVFTAVGLRVRVMTAFRNTRNKIAEVNACLQENISGVRVVQAFTREKVNLSRFEKLNRENFQANLQATTLLAVFVPMVEITAAVGTVLVIWYGTKLIVAQEITVGILAAFLGYVTRFYSPIRDLSTIWNQLQSAMASSERVFEILDTEPEIQEFPNCCEIPVPKGEVEFKDVSFSYDSEVPVLREVNLQVGAGERIALVGPTGGGKSSIINLIARFYQPTTGIVSIDGINVNELAFKSLREIVGIVLQDTFVFAGTVMDNIIFGRPQAGRAEVERIAKLTGAHTFISTLPRGYDTEIMERGIRLSTGQRQLLACTRALLADPKILILDEATANLDVASEQAVQHALRILMQGRTSFIIAHRLSTIREADRILVIDEGQIVEAGNHGELLNKGGM